MANRNIKTLFIIWLCGWNAANAKKTTRNDASEVPEPAFPQNNCRILINEINLYSSNDDQYIELSKYCGTQPTTQRAITMQNFKLLFVSHDAKLVGVCHLAGEITNTQGRYWFYVIANTNKNGVNFDISNCQLDSEINLVPGGQKMFPGGANYPFAIVLVYNAYLPALDDLKLLPNTDQLTYSYRIITDKLQNKIMKYTQDMYVVATTSPYQYCAYFQSFYTGYNRDSIHILREWQADFNTPDHAISRCANPTLKDKTTLLFQPFLWVYSEKTLGNKNKCGTAYRFIVETTQPLRKRPRPNNELEDPRFQCFSLFEDPANDVNIIAYPHTYHQGLQDAQRQAELNGPNNELVVNDRFIALGDPSLDSQDSQGIQFATNNDMQSVVFDDFNDGTNDVSTVHDNLEDDVEVAAIITTDENQASDGRKLPKLLLTANPLSSRDFEDELDRNSPTFPGDPTKFSEDRKNEILEIPGTPIDINDVLQQDVCTWFSYLMDVGKFRCKLCHYLLNQKIMYDSKNSPNINYIMWKGVGYLTGIQRKSQNRQLIRTHVKNPLHLVAVDYFTLRDQGLRGSALQTAFERRGGPWREYLKPTEQLLIDAFQSVKMNLSFYNFKKLTNLLNFYKTSIGHVHSGEDGMKKIVMVISNKFHKDFVSQLLSNQKPLSLTLDLSTDINGFPIAAFLFQTYSNDGQIRVYMYRLIEAKEGEAGTKIFELFKNALKEDGLEDYVKQNMFGLSTDGAPNVLKVFRNQLNTYVTNEIVATHCCAHRIELVNKRVFEEYTYLRSIDQNVNELFKFFNNKSAKRKRVLRQMFEWTQPGQPAKIKRWELKRIIKIRFINSKLRALSAIVTHWKDVGAALQDISERNDFKFEHRQLAEKLMEKLQDGTYLATLAFLIDVDQELSAISLQLQTRGVTLIPKKMMRDTLVNRMSELKLSNRPALTKLLEDAEFDVDDTEGFERVNLESFETQDIRLQGVSLQEPNALYDDFRLYKNKNLYLDSLLTQIDNYFPHDVTDKLFILDPNNFPTVLQDFDTYGAAEIVELNEKLKWKEKWGFENEAVKNGWKRLAVSLFRDPGFSNHISKKPEDFWSLYLTVDTIAWTPELTKIISNIITAPCTSVEPERLFSLYSATKTKRRFSLNPTTVEAIVRIKYMGPENIEEFDSLSMALEFMEHYSRADDVSRRTTWAKTKPTTSPVVADSSDSDSDYEDI